MTVASLSGGMGIIIADTAETQGLSVASWTPEWQARLDSYLPAYLGRANPIDLGGGPFLNLSDLIEILKVLDANPDSDVTVVGIANFEVTQDAIAEAIIKASDELAKPLVVVWYGAAEGRVVRCLGREFRRSPSQSTP